MAAGLPQLRSIAPVPVDTSGRTREIDAWFVTGPGGRPDVERAIHARLVAALEAERAHIARELHDVVGQALTTVRLNLLSLDRQDPQSGASEVRINSSLAAVDEAIRQVRTAAFELRPAVLDDLGLAAAMRTLCRQVARRSNVTVSCRVSIGDIRLPAEVETTCYRVALEAITNAVRHSSARHVSVNVRSLRRTSTLVLEVCDDGVGFDPSGCSGTQCIGLLGMAERAAMVDGSVEIRSGAGDGTLVIARFRVARLPVQGQ